MVLKTIYDELLNIFWWVTASVASYYYNKRERGDQEIIDFALNTQFPSEFVNNHNFFISKMHYYTYSAHSFPKFTEILTKMENKMELDILSLKKCNVAILNLDNKTDDGESVDITRLFNEFLEKNHRCHCIIYVQDVVKWLLHCLDMDPERSNCCSIEVMLEDDTELILDKYFITF